MSKYLMDTNAILDFLVPARPQHENIRKFVELVDKRSVDQIAVFSASLNDVYYIFNRHYGTESVSRKIVSQMRGFFEIIELTLDVLDMAILSNEPDFEDALVRAATELSGCDYIISRDVCAFKNSECIRVDPAEALVFLGI